jgi:Glyoxalase-like domain
VIAVGALAAAGREFEALYGLRSIPGARHPGWGTANRIVPLGETYLELVAVIDELDAVRAAFGSWVARADRSTPRPLGWAVCTGELDRVASTLGLAVGTGSRITPGGRRLRWRLAGVERAAAEPSLPFFIEWGDGSAAPARGAVTHPAGRVELARLELRGDADRVANWLGPHELPIVVRPGSAAVTRVVLDGPAAEIALRA